AAPGGQRCTGRWGSRRRAAPAGSAIVGSTNYSAGAGMGRWPEPEAGADRSGRPRSSANPGNGGLMSGETEIRPFRVDMPDEDLTDLRRRIAAARLPGKELVDDRSQGVQLATIQELARYWTTGYDWRACEARLNALPMFKTEIEGVAVHFIHVKSPPADALPLIMTHGWPGSVIELLETVGPLTDPAAHGGSAGDAFHLVLPSIPGYGFSAEPAELGWYSGRVAQAWAELMRR